MRKVDTSRSMKVRLTFGGPRAEMMVVKFFEARMGKRVSAADGRVPCMICWTWVRWQ